MELDEQIQNAGEGMGDTYLGALNAPGQKKSSTEEGVFAFEDKTKIAHVKLAAKAKNFKTASEFIAGIKEATPGKISSVDEKALEEFYTKNASVEETVPTE